MANSSKDTIYIDVDDEITAIIDKVKASSGKVIALVLPKRAAVLQSVVNMKLLKRTSDNEKKSLVLITSEAGLLPLAGAVRMHVAKTLSSVPEIPSPPKPVPESETVNEDMNLDDEDEPDLTQKAGAESVTVGALSDAAGKKHTKQESDIESLDLDAEDDKAKSSKSKSGKKNKHLKVPNFNRFRVILLLSIIGVAAIATLLVFALAIWPKAIISIKTNAASVNTQLNLTLDTGAKSVNTSSMVIPATQVSEQKTYTQTVNTTGQKNEGVTASGTVTMSANDCGPNYNYAGNPSTYTGFTIPAGTSVSYNNLTYLTQNDTSMVNSNYDFKTQCFTYKASGSTNIAAQSPGASYNASISGGTVSGFPGVSADGSASGGTDNVVQVVAQADVTTATSKINTQNSAAAQQSLVNQLKGQGLYPIDVTFTKSAPQISTSPNVGDQSSTVTVTETITYTMIGASKSDIDSLVNAAVRSQTSKSQNIINNGITQNAFKQVSASGNTDQVSLSVLAQVGPNISISELKKEVAGKSPDAAITAIKQNPDVTSVTVKLSPFWVSSIPGSTSKITINVAKPSGSS